MSDETIKPLNLEWTNFRGFRQKTSITLPRLTLLIGRNNVGKSSTYAPLLVMKQTLGAKDPRTALLGRGPLIDIGPFADYVSDHDTTHTMRFRVSIPTSRLRRRDQESMPSAMEMGFRSHDGADAFLSNHRLENPSGDALIARSRKIPDEAFTFNSSMLPTVKSTGRPYREISAVRASLRGEQPQGFLFSGIGGILVPQFVRENEERWAAARPWYNAAFALYDLQTDANSKITELLQKIAYLGPLRSLPHRTYRLEAEPPSDVGVRGEHAPELLFRHDRGEITENVNTWLKRLGYGRLDFQSIGNEYFQANLITPAGLRVNLADTGVGLSQVIPLLVQGSVATSGALVIAQQPEIHLNPAQQAILTDFLIHRASQGVRVLAETHSEHMLLRVRRRIAEGDLSADDVAVYFVEDGTNGTEVRRVPVGELGEIDREDWPQGFFEDQLSEAFALSSAQARRRTK